jgi:cell wall-associated NlpC family hydrolase
VAIRFAHRVRPVLLIAALGAGAIAGPTIASASPHHPKPTVTSVQKQLGELALQNSQLVEKFDHARVVLATRQKQATAAERAASRAQSAYLAARTNYARVVQAQYESGGSITAAGALLESDSGNNYLDRLDTMDLVSAHNAEVVQQMSKARAAATTQAQRAQRLLTDATNRRNALAQQKKDVAAKIDKYQRLLATLTSAQQAAYEQQINPQVSQSTLSTIDLPRASSRQAQIAVQFALDQVGKPYIFGAAGPSAFDCSGLTMAAWHAAGVNLPHSAADQYNYGHHVSRDQLKPGDLIFFYQPIGHVTIYIGNGLMVSAPDESEPVSVVPLAYFNSDYVGATRL